MKCCCNRVRRGEAAKDLAADEAERDQRGGGRSGRKEEIEGKLDGRKEKRMTEKNVLKLIGVGGAKGRNRRYKRNNRLTIDEVNKC